MKLENLCRLKFKKILRTHYFRATQNFKSLSRILCPNFGTLYIDGKERFHKNINGYDFEICRHISRCKNVVEI